MSKYLRQRLGEYLQHTTLVTAAVLGTTPAKRRRGCNDTAYEMVRRTLEVVHAQLVALDESLDLETKPKAGWPEDTVPEDND